MPVLYCLITHMSIKLNILNINVIGDMSEELCGFCGNALDNDRDDVVYEEDLSIRCMHQTCIDQLSLIRHVVVRDGAYIYVSGASRIIRRNMYKGRAIEPLFEYDEEGDEGDPTHWCYICPGCLGKGSKDKRLNRRTLFTEDFNAGNVSPIEGEDVLEDVRCSIGNCREYAAFYLDILPDELRK